MEEWEEVPDCDLRAGDMVDVFGGIRRITAIRPYVGPLPFVIGIADTVPSGSFSLLDSSRTKRLAKAKEGT